MARESLLIATIVELADNLVDNYDVIDILTLLSDRCQLALDVDAVGVMLASPGGELQFIASSTEAMRVLELFQIQCNEGPCVDCFRDGSAIVNCDLKDVNGRWPEFTPRALAYGFRSVHCLPLRLRGQTIGALNLFRSRQGPLAEDDVIVAQGMADIATIAVLQHRTSLDSTILNQQLNLALNSRIIIEQAKGMISQGTNCTMAEAFERLRAHSRDHNVGLTLVATQLVDGSLSSNELAFPHPKKKV